MSVFIKMNMPKDCSTCPLNREWNYCQFTGRNVEGRSKRPKDCPLFEPQENKSAVSDICMVCRHCKSEEITEGLDGYYCEEDMENFYNGNQEGCYQFWRKEDEYGYILTKREEDAL